MLWWLLRFVLRMNLLLHGTKHWTEKLTNNRNQPLTTTTCWGLTQAGIFFLHNLPGETQNAWVCSRIATENTQQSSSPYGMQTSITSQDQDQQGYCGHPSPTLPQGFHSSVHPIVHSFIRSPYQLVWCGWKHVGDKVSSYSQLIHFSGVPPSMTNPLMTPCF